MPLEVIPQGGITFGGKDPFIIKPIDRVTCYLIKRKKIF